MTRRALTFGPRKRLVLGTSVAAAIVMVLLGVALGLVAVSLLLLALLSAFAFLAVEIHRRVSLAAEERTLRVERRLRGVDRRVRSASDHAQKAASAAKRAAEQADRVVSVVQGKKRADPPTGSVDPQLQPGWWAERLWCGFTEDAVAALSELAVDRRAAPAARAQACLELARWHTTHGRHDSALRYAVLGRVAHPPIGGKPLQAALEADLLTLTSRGEEARALLETAGLDFGLEADRLLRLANSHRGGPDEETTAGLRRLGLVNQVFLRAGYHPLSLADPALPLSLENLWSPAGISPLAGPKVTVLMPAYQAADVIERALGSVLAQTWQNLEIVVVDDASRDATVERVQSVMAGDARVRLLQRPVNQGAYSARNAGLEAATGDLVTVHDTDDWSHPQKLETLVAALEREPSLVAALAHHVRTFTDLTFTAPTLRPSQRLIAANRSSLMIRRSVFDEIGTWDAVRASGDSELLGRLQAVYGEPRVAWVEPEVPLSFSHTGPDSLTGSALTGFASMWQALGARRQYQMEYRRWHRSTSFADDLPFVADPASPTRRVPALIRVDRSHRTHFDVVMLSDFSLPGGTTGSNLAEITACAAAGMTVGLLHHRPRAWNQLAPLNPKFERVVDGDRIRHLSHGEDVTCDLLLARFPRSVEHLMDEMPRVRASQVRMIVNQLPRRRYGVTDSPPTYDIVTCQESLESRFDADVVWHPISPLVGAALRAEHGPEVSRIDLSDQAWLNIIDVETLRRKRPRPRDGAIRIGRHTRDDVDKWPEDPQALRDAYPSAAGYEIHVLGGATVPAETLGTLPGNWVVHPFGSRSVRRFLHELDVFVYFTHSGCIEAFGRTILEALAVGLPVIAPSYFEPLFGDAVIYAEPREVKTIVETLMSDQKAYERHIARARQIVTDRFSHDAFLLRLRDLGVGGGDSS